MSNKIFNTRVQNKIDTEANWEQNNPVLLNGEIIIVITENDGERFKIGDGTKTYSELPFQDQPVRDLIPENILTEENIVDTLVELDMLIAVEDSDGAILADENGNILSM